LALPPGQLRLRAGRVHAAGQPAGRAVTRQEGRGVPARHDLWARSLSDGREWALTTDGEPDYQYGSGPDCTSNGTLLRKFGLPHLPPAVAWSPDSTKVLAHRTDERGVRQTHLVEARPANGGAPLLRTQRYAYAGDENMPQAQLLVLDVAEGAVARAQAEPLLMPQLSPIMIKQAWWAPDGSAVY
jgi:dipeptidyl-peptidase 4